VRWYWSPSFTRLAMAVLLGRTDAGYATVELRQLTI
jgi:hypothetical protein